MSLDIEEYKKVLHVDLNSMEAISKVDESLWEYIGGIAVSYKLLLDYYDENPIILSTGPLAGCFPYLSKANLVYTSSNKVFEKYGGGTIASLLNFSGFDAIIIKGQTNKNISLTIGDEVSIEEIEGIFDPKEYDLALSRNAVLSKNYFSFGNFDEAPLYLNSNIGIKVLDTQSINLYAYYDYENWYTKILDRYKELTVEPRNNPSCMGCPMGCDFSSVGEDDIKTSVLPRCLVSCAYAEAIYKDIPLVFGCLNSVGYKYRHKHLENLPTLFGELKTSLNDRL